MKRRLELAADHYGRATQLKPRENAFWGPRIAPILAMAGTGLVAQVEHSKKRRRPGQIAAGPAGVATTTDLYQQVRSKMPAPPIAITNQTVIRWVKSGYSADYISSSIKHAPELSLTCRQPKCEAAARGCERQDLKAMKSRSGAQLLAGVAYGRSRGAG